MFNISHTLLNILLLPFSSQHLPISKQTLSPSSDLAKLWICHVVPQTLPTLEGEVYNFIGIEFTALQVC